MGGGGKGGEVHPSPIGHRRQWDDGERWMSSMKILLQASVQNK